MTLTISSCRIGGSGSSPRATPPPSLPTSYRPAALLVRDTDPHAKFLAKVERELKFRYDHSIPIPNPVLHYLRESAWVNATDGKRCRPSEIMLNAHGVRVLRGIYTQHAIDVRDPLIAAHGGRDAA